MFRAGRAGLFFSHLPPASQKYLRNWFAHRRLKRKDAVRVLLPQESLDTLAGWLPSSLGFAHAMLDSLFFGLTSACLT